MLKLDLYIALVLFLFPMGWSMSGFQPSIVLACVCWGITLLLLIHAFWIYEKTSQLSLTTKVVWTVIAVGIVVLWAWTPVKKESAKSILSLTAPSL